MGLRTLTSEHDNTRKYNNLEKYQRRTRKRKIQKTTILPQVSNDYHNMSTFYSHSTSYDTDQFSQKIHHPDVGSLTCINREG